MMHPLDRANFSDEFDGDNQWQRACREVVLVPGFYRARAHQERFVFLDEVKGFSARLQRECHIDSIMQVAGGKVERSGGDRPGENSSQAGTGFRGYLKDLNLNKDRAQDAQRIGTLPDADLEAAFALSRERGGLITTAELIRIARPYWYKASREKKHRDIANKAQELSVDLGSFPLVYADPPWKFEIYSPKGLERTPDQHYPTLTDDEIINFKIGGKPVTELFHKDATLLLWCTSSNLCRALAIMDGWGFTYKTHSIWDKEKTGLGLVFRNQHEVLLYGTCGKMPGPQYQPPSVFRYPRGEHSAKPPEIRAEIEKMYPDFDEQTRLELFARSDPQGWAAYGYEAH